MLGRLALAGLNSRTALSAYCAAVWAIVVEAPHEAIQKITDQLIVSEAVRDPERARETWGVLPEHQAGARKAEGTELP